MSKKPRLMSWVRAAKLAAIEQSRRETVRAADFIGPVNKKIEADLRKIAVRLARLGAKSK